MKVIGIGFVILLVIDITALILFSILRPNVGIRNSESIEMECSIQNKDYIISVGTDGYFNCSNCSSELQNDLKNNYIDFSDLSKTLENINNYFKNNNGICE